MMALPLVGRVRACLQENGPYRFIGASVTVASVPFDFAAVLLAKPPLADLILVVDTDTEGMERVRRRLEALARALDTVQSRRPVTAILVGPRPSADALSTLLRCCRVLIVEAGEQAPTDEEIRDRLAVLLPFHLTGHISELADPDGELERRAAMLPDGKSLAALIDASHQGQEAVKTALGKFLGEPLAAPTNEDTP